MELAVDGMWEIGGVVEYGGDSAEEAGIKGGKHASPGAGGTFSLPISLIALSPMLLGHPPILGSTDQNGVASEGDGVIMGLLEIWL